VNEVSCAKDVEITKMLDENFKKLVKFQVCHKVIANIKKLTPKWYETKNAYKVVSSLNQHQRRRID
jgi:hypothetical protein